MAKTNIEKVTRLMDFSKAGPMSQIMIMEAIRFYTEMVVNNGEPEEPKGEERPLVNPVAWYHTARIVHDELEEMMNESDIGRKDQTDA